MKDKNKEAIKIVEENRLTNIYSPEDKIRMDIDKQIEVDDRGPLDLTRQVEETDKRVKELDKSLSIALEINDRYQRDCKKLNEQLEDKVEEVKALKMKLELLDNKTQK